MSEFLLNGIVSNAVNVPNVDLRTLSLIRPYLTLGEKLGKLLAQIAPHRFETLTINYTGKVSETETGAESHRFDFEGAPLPVRGSRGE